MANPFLKAGQFYQKTSSSLNIGHQWMATLFTWLDTLVDGTGRFNLYGLYMGNDPRVAYTTTGKKGFQFDGTDSPLVAELRFVDQVTGAIKKLTINNSVATVS